MNHTRVPNLTDISKSLEHAEMLNRFLKIILQDKPLKTVLEQALDELLALSWLAVLRKGGVFLIDDSGTRLELFAQRNLGKQIIRLCALVPLGHCLCGLAAATGKSQHTSCILNTRLDIASEGIDPHGRYSIPIIAEQRVLGVLVVKLPHGHQHCRDEVAFLENLADILAMLIDVKKREEGVLSSQSDLKDAMAETAALMGTIKTHTLFSQTSVDGKITDVNEAFCQISGYTRDELIGRSHSIVNSNCHSPSFWAEFWRSITAGKAWRGEICNRNKKGQLYWVDSIVMPFLNGDGEIQRYVSIRFEITERKQAEEALARMGRILDDSSNEIYVFQADSLHFSQLNRGARENLGYTADEITSLTPIDIKPDYTRESFVEIIQPLLQHKTDRLSFETLHLRKDGSRYPVAINLQYAAEETPPVFVAIVQDITERKAKDERIERLAFYDPLTGLPNRALMTDRLRKCVERAKTDACTVQLLYLDLDRFKEINDTRGHAIGDRFLAAVAHRFQSVVRPSETLARIGGDEFVILIEDGDETRTFEILKRLKAQLRRPIAVDGKSHSLGVSIGVATYPQSGKSPEALLQLADIAMYHAKAQGGGHRFYDHEMGEQLARRLQIADRLADALASNRLELHYQPIVELETGRLMGAEALLRWHETDWGWVPPDEFIPIAEERRMLVEIGPWVIDRACWQYADWRRQGLRCPQRLSVNVAAQQMEGATLLQSFQTSLKRHGVPASVMEAEITESSMMKDPQRTAEILTEMKALGVRLSIDDFGTGYSSLAYLNQFRTDKLKIDMSFVRDLMDDKNCQAIVSATIGMARGLGLSVLAEGVESHDQADHLRQLNCDEAQGYLFGKAVPADEFARVWLASPVDCALTGT